MDKQNARRIFYLFHCKKVQAKEKIPVRQTDRLRLCVFNAGGLSSIPGQGTRSHMWQLKIPHATTKTQQNQIDKNKEINV